MNPQMRLVIMLAVLWASGSLLFAAQPASPPVASSEPPVAEPPEEGKADEQAEETAGTDALPAEDRDPESERAPATAAGRAGTPQRFTPSEQVRADFDVSFPVDI